MVLEGALEITSGSDKQEVSRGCMLHFDPAERRTVRATSDSTLLYLLAPWPGVGHPSLGRGNEAA
ncbi:MAG: hypothetical protein QOF76_3398 [Solirubrobacteraceae bacterium]|nr:hypothetical protein [Solirubrobacteraceae bacterium]